MRLRRDDSFLLVVDVQEKLAPHVLGFQRIIARAAALVTCGRLLDVPVLFSEHAPDRIGSTVPSLARIAHVGEVLKKVHFACTDQPECLQRFTGLKKKQVLLAGMEAHVCVMQTALGLCQNNFEVFLVRDAVGSRKEEDCAAAMERMRAAGCRTASAEMAMFEWLGNADVPEFRDVLKLVKNV